MRPTPAAQLIGMTLNDKWFVEEAFDRGQNATGSCFSIGYRLKSSSGTKGFLKALDFSSALQSPDPARALQSLTAAFNFERDVLNKCRDSRLDKVVVALDDGSVEVDFEGKKHVVQYIIFELADGDIRKQLEALRMFDLALILRVLHHTAIGLRQLHKEGIAHQDLKPSNVLSFNNDLWKVGDLGRSAFQGVISPHEDYALPGDPSYAPPEQCYGFAHPEWNVRRLGCDAYQLGSLIVFLITGVNMTAIWMKMLDPDHRPRRWSGNFQEVLPYLRNAFGQAVSIVETEMKTKLGETGMNIQNELLGIIRELCDPDPLLRCNVRSRLSGKLLIERYITQFDRLAKRAEITFRP